MAKFFNILFLVLLVNLGLAQYSVTPSVINSAGGSGEITVSGQKYIIDYNIGEPIITTVSSSVTPGITITQGFLQPDSFEVAFKFTIDSISAKCFGENGKITMGNNKGASMSYSYIGSSTSATFSCNGDSCIIDTTSGFYQIIVQATESGVQYEATVNITLEESTEMCDLVVYSGFTPDGNGTNDRFVIDFIDNYADNTVTIFNRWGVKIWETTNYNNITNAWGGTNIQTGKLVPSGTYFYVIELKNEKGNKKGWVELSY